MTERHYRAVWMTEIMAGVDSGVLTYLGNLVTLRSAQPTLIDAPRDGRYTKP